MTPDKLREANEIQKEIDELEHFIDRASSVWTGRLIKRTSKFLFKSNAYGVVNEATYNMNTEMKNKVLALLRQHLKELYDQLESL